MFLLTLSVKLVFHSAAVAISQGTLVDRLMIETGAKSEAE